MPFPNATPLPLHQPTGWRYAVAVLAVSAGYVATGWLGLELATTPDQVTAVWAPSGIALAAVLLGGYRMLPAVFLGAFAVNAFKGPVGVAFFIAVGNSTGAALGAWLLQQVVALDPALQRLRDVLGLAFLGAGISTMAAASIGVATLYAAGELSPDPLQSVWGLWWLGDAMGVLIAAPPILTWAASPARPSRARLMEAAGLFLLLVTVSNVIFRGPIARTSQLQYLVFPFLVWSALRLGQAMTASAVFVVAAIAIMGIFEANVSGEPTLNEPLILLQSFMGVLAVTCLSLGAASTERERAQAALGASEGLLRAVVETAVDGIITINERGLVRTMNPAAERIFGRAAAEMTGQNISRLMPEPYHSEHDGYLRNYLRTGQARIIGIGREVRGLRKDGTVFPLELAVSETLVGDRRIFTGIVRDITERKQAEAALRESEERLRLAAEAAQLGVWTRDVATNAVRWSPELEAIFGLAPGTFGGTEQAFFDLVHPEDRERIGVEVRRAVESSEPYEIEFRFRRADGQERWMIGRGRAYYDELGRPARLAGVGIDITERKHAEEELARHRDRLEELVTERTAALRQSVEQLRRSERLASLGTLAAGIAHEINNPLNSITIAAHYALRSPQADAREALQTILDEAQRGGQIVRGVLKFAREEPGVKTPGDLNEVVLHAVDLAKTYVPSGGSSVACDLAESLPPVPMGRTEIEQVVVNLIKNAIEAGNGSVAVTIRTRPFGSGVQLSVEDTGPGIPADVLPHIFDPFYSTRRSAGGTGLGLSICHGIIADHGGSITVRSEPGAGTSFDIRLPGAPQTL